jgi:hypothetical protein
VPQYPSLAPSPHPARRTGRADLPHPALGQGRTPRRVGVAAGRGTPPGGSEPFCGGDRLIATLLALVPLPAPSLNSGRFPPPALPGFAGTTSPSATPGSPACPARASGCGPLPRTAWGFPCCVGSPLRACHRQYPGGTAGSDRSWDGLSQPFPSLPATSAFPGTMAGRLPPHCFRGLLGVHSRCGLPARGATLWPFASKAPAASLPPPPLRLLPAGAIQVPGGDFTHGRPAPYHGAHTSPGQKLRFLKGLEVERQQ